MPVVSTLQRNRVLLGHGEWGSASVFQWRCGGPERPRDLPKGTQPPAAEMAVGLRSPLAHLGSLLQGPEASVIHAQTSGGL